MKIPKPQLFAAIFPLAAMLILVPARTHADTYKIYDLGGTPDGHFIVGIDNLGQVVILDENGGLFTSYLTYDNGVLVSTTSTLPNLTYDDGAPCSAPPGFATVDEASICNNGRVAFGSALNPNGDSGGVYTGPVSSLTLIRPGVADTSGAELNSSGDFAWTDGSVEENYEAVDLTTQTPEPSSLVLLGTGCFSLLCVLRRKLF
jgi:hypothetical protein